MDIVCKYCKKTFYTIPDLENHVVGFNEDEQLNCKGALKKEQIPKVVKIIKLKTNKEFDAILSLLKLSQNDL